MGESQKKFIASEKKVQECEENLTALSQEQSSLCFIQPAGNHRWIISSKEKPGIQIGVAIDEKTGSITHLNWRQIFE